MVSNIEELTEEQQAERAAKDQAKRRKAIGIPEVDPDSLPSSTAQKHMCLLRTQAC